MIAGLPVKEIDTTTYTAADLRLTRSGQSCASAKAPAVLEECRTQGGTTDDLVDIMMWRRVDEFSARLMREGATSITTTALQGRTHGGAGVFNYRLTAISFENEDAARTSTPLVIAENCHISAEHHAGTSAVTRRVFMAGAEPHTVILSESKRLIIVEGRLGLFESTVGLYPETPSGLLPKNAALAMADWFAANAPK